jgi:hypothetical protein
MHDITPIEARRDDGSTVTATARKASVVARLIEAGRVTEDLDAAVAFPSGIKPGRGLAGAV